jgi:hypothetical protein
LTAVEELGKDLPVTSLVDEQRRLLDDLHKIELGKDSAKGSKFVLDESKRQLLKRIPISIESSKYTYLDQLVYKHDQTLTFDLFWVDENGLIRYMHLFFDQLFCFRLTDESDLLHQPTETAEDITEWSLYTVENSYYIKWFQEISCGLNSNRIINHYFIYTQDDIIEVLSEKLPEIKMSEKSPTNW